MKRIIALVLSLVMALSLCVPAWGAEITPNGLPTATAKDLETKTITATTSFPFGKDAKEYDLDVGFQFLPNEETASEPYKYWHADYVISANKIVRENSLALAGYYQAFCKDYNDDNWVLLNASEDIAASTEIRLVELLGATVNYEEICKFGNDGVGFLCGVVDLTGQNAGTTITVELRLYETEEPSEANGNSRNKETGNYAVIGTYNYTFEGAVAEVDGIGYATLQEAVDVGGEVKLLDSVTESATVSAGKVVTLNLNGKTLTANVSVNNGGNLTIKDSSSPSTGKLIGSISNEGKVSITGGTFNTDPTPSVAEGYKVVENNGMYTVMKTYNVTFDANGGTNEYTLAPVVEGKLVLPNNPFTAPSGKQFKAWSVNGKEYAEGAEIDVAADVEVIAVWESIPVYYPPVVDVPTQTPTEKPAETPTETPSETPVETPTQTPVGTPVETPVEVVVPVGGNENTVKVEATVTGTTATVDKVDMTELATVIGNDVDTGKVVIDFSTVSGTTETTESGETVEVAPVDTVQISAEVIKEIAEAVANPENNAESLEIVLGDGASIEFNAEALAEKVAQAGGDDITISIKPTTAVAENLSSAQLFTVGENVAFDITVTSGGVAISDMGGEITITAPYELSEGETAEGIVVYYVDDEGNREKCETFYDAETGRVSWKTNHLSVYMVAYEAPADDGAASDSPADDAQSGSPVLWIVIAVVVVVAIVAAVVISKKRKN